MAAPLNRKPERTVQPGQLIGTEPLSLTLPQPDSSHGFPVLHLVFEGHGISPELKPSGQALQPEPGFPVHQIVGVQVDALSQKLLPAPNRIQLIPDSPAQRLGRDRLQGPARPAPQLIQFCQASPQTVLIRMCGLASPQRRGQNIARLGLQLRGDLLLQRFDFGFQLKSEVRSPPLYHQSLVFARTTEDNLGWTKTGVLPDQIVRQCRSLYRGAGRAEPVC